MHVGRNFICASILLWTLLLTRAPGALGQVASEGIAADSGQTRLLLLSPALGQVAPHRPEMAGLLGRRCQSVEVGWGRTSNQPWTRSGRRQGAAAFWSLHLTETNSTALGAQAALLRSIHWPLAKGLFTETGLGVGYSWTPYDPESRPTAIALGSHVNAAIRLGVGWGGRCGSRTAWQTGLRLTHLSNGGITQPNLGTNQVDFALALLWSSKQEASARTSEVESDSTRVWRLVMQAGPRDLGLPRGTRAWLTSVRWLRMFPKALHNRAWVPVAGLGTTLAARHNGRAPQVFIEAGGVWDYGRLQLMATWGAVLAGTNATQGPVFLQVDLLGQIRPSLALSLSLRSYRLRAEHPALGVVWSI